MGKIIAFSNQKGGVGKTTTCVNMTSYMAAKGYKCLIIDLDPQGNATSGLGIRKSDVKSSIYDVMIDDMAIEETIIKTKVEGLDIVPSSIEFAGAEVEIVYRKNRDFILKKALQKAKEVYDFITIDCPPSLSVITVNALAAADSVIIPIQSEYYALEGLSQLLNTIKLVVKHDNPDLKIEGAVITMSDSRALISRQIVEEIKRFFGKRLYCSVIPRNIRISEAPSHGVPIMLHDPRCSGAKAYLSLTEEFIARQPKDVIAKQKKIKKLK